MFATFHKAPQIAEEFWLAVRDGEKLDKDDPRHVLRTWLLQSNLAKAVYLDSSQKTVTSEEMYRACIYHWNNFRAGRKAKTTRVAMDQDRPEAK